MLSVAIGFDRRDGLNAHNARIADMEFPIGEYIAEPIAYFTGGWKKWFEKK